MTPGETLDVLRRRTLPELVQAEIERLIADGTLPPGEPLREAALAERLGVSRGPVREAFRALDERGLVTVVKNVGVRVRTLDAREIDEIHALRLVLEREIGAGAAVNATPAAIAALESVYAAMSAASASHDAVAYASANFRFHDELARASGNRRLHDVYARLVAELSLARQRSHARAPGSLDVSLKEHRAVLDAVVRGDARTASETLVAHARNGRSRLGDTLDIEPVAAHAAAHPSER